MADIKQGKLSSIKPTRRNSNKHTAKGLKALDNSMAQDGYVAPMTATADGEIIDGDARLHAAFERFGDEALVIHHDGKKPIVMIRDDIPNADDPMARRIHYRANMVQVLDFDLDSAQVMADIEAGFDFEAIDVGLADLGEMLQKATSAMLPTDPANDPNEEWQGMPEFENEPKAARTLYIHFAEEEDVEAFAKLISQSITDKTKSLWYPIKQDNLHMDKTLRYE